MSCCPRCGFSDSAFAYNASAKLEDTATAQSSTPKSVSSKSAGIAAPAPVMAVPAPAFSADTFMPVIPHSEGGTAKFKFKVRPGEQVKDINPRRQSQAKAVSWDELERISTAGLIPVNLEIVGQPQRQPTASVAPPEKERPVPTLPPERHHHQWQWRFRKESFILLALLIETCMVTADYYSPIFQARKKTVETVAVARGPNHVLLNFINSAQVPVQVRVNNHLIALGRNESFQKSLPKGLCQISWWCEAAGKQSDKCLAEEQITGDTDWEFELVFLDDKPVVLRTVPDQQSKSASPVE